MAFTFSNAQDKYRKRAVNTVVGDWWIGCYVTGVSSGATGILVNFASDFDGEVTSFTMFLLTATDFSTLETCNITNGGSFVQGSGAGTLTTKATMQVTGTLDTDTTVDLSKNMGAVGPYGGKLVTTVNMVGGVPSDSYKWDRDITVTAGSTISVGDYLQIDNELLLVNLKPSTNVARCRRSWRQNDTFGNSPAHVNGSNVYRVGMNLTGVTNINLWGYIRIDDEYVRIISSEYAPTYMVERGQLGSTIAEHTSGASVYYVDESFFYQCYNASVSNVWGYDSLVAGRMNLSCNIILGHPTQATPTVAVSALETIAGTSSILMIGYNDTTRRTKLSIGKGDTTDEIRSMQGSNVLFNGLDTNCISRAIVGTRYGSLDVFCSNTKDISHYDGGCFIRSTSTDAVEVLSSGVNDHQTIWRDILTHSNLNPSSTLITYSRLMVSDAEYGCYFVYGFAEPNILDFRLLNTSQDAFAFVDAFNKNFINSSVDVYNMDGYWADPIYNDKKTVDITIKNLDGSPIPNVSIKAWNVSGTLVIDQTTDSLGQIPQQLITIKVRNMTIPLNTIYNPFRFFISKPGWRELQFTHTFTKQVEWVLTLMDYELSEDIQYQ
jgi:hypothetical protein